MNQARVIYNIPTTYQYKIYYLENALFALAGSIKVSHSLDRLSDELCSVTVFLYVPHTAFLVRTDTIQSA
jgi:hypothetical protein